MDCVRAIQFMASRPTSDMNNLYAEGQSQGGAFTYAAASLSGYTFRAIAPAIAFMGDFPDYFDIVNWPAYVARENQGAMTDDEMFAFLSYFDTKNLATNIACPVIACIGLQDNVCPPHTNIAPYNNLLSTDKELIFNPENYYQAGNTWYSDFMQFFLDRRTTTFVAQDLTLEATDGTNYWATFSNTDAVTFFPTAAATIYTVNVVSDELQLAALTPEDATINSVVTNGCFVPANTGVLVQTDATSVPYYTVFNHAVDALSDNMLYPGNDEVITAPAASDYYLLAYGDNVPTLSTLGFYWGADEGAAFKARKGGAYLAVPQGLNAPSRLIINAPGNATDITTVDTNDSTVKFLRNGQLLILKQGVLYNALGKRIQ